MEQQQMKKLSVLLLSLVMLLSFATGAQASGTTQPVTVWLGEEQVDFGTRGPVIENATMLVPARAILEQLGYELIWDVESASAHAVSGDQSITLVRGEAVGLDDGEPYALTAAPRVKDNTMYAPLRFIAESSGYRVIWDGASRSALLVPQDSEGFLWKVEKDGALAYLLGSIHVGSELMYPLPESIKSAFSASDHLAVEVDITQPLSPEQAAAMQAKMMFDDGTSLPDYLSEEAYAKLQDILRSIGAPENAFDPFKPWQISNELVMLKSLLGGFEAGLGIDLYLLHRAAITGKPVHQLESLELQLDMFDSFPMELQAGMLTETILAFDQLDDSIGPMTELWHSGDESQLEEMTNSLQAQPDYYKAVIEDRNVGMADKIEGYLSNEDQEIYFVVAGYLHMLGDHGVVKLLEERGYAVTRV